MGEWAVIEIAFYKGRTRWLDRVIQWWTKGPYSHCEVVTHRRKAWTLLFTTFGDPRWVDVSAFVPTRESA